MSADARKPLEGDIGPPSGGIGARGPSVRPHPHRKRGPEGHTYARQQGPRTPAGTSWSELIHRAARPRGSAGGSIRDGRQPFGIGCTGDADRPPPRLYDRGGAYTRMHRRQDEGCNVRRGEQRQISYARTGAVRIRGHRSSRTSLRAPRLRRPPAGQVVGT